ncbi:cation:proton antiporter [Candidatus Mcinerneyibacteriota bacterium]|nr:cation:proton antiporter [Candidatus Mcinerneyibacteriota bacterium]
MLPFSIEVHDPILLFAIIMALSLLAPRLALKARIPSIIGLIAAGVIFGPHVLGILPEHELIEALSEVGLLYIMFISGLEIDLHQLNKHFHHSLIFGLLTFSIPLLMGTTSAMALLSLSLTASLLLASMFSSHTLVTYPIASRFGLSKTPSTTSSIGATVVTDLLAFIILAVISSSYHKEISLAFWIHLIAAIILYVSLMVWLIPKIGRWYFKNISQDNNVDFIFIFTVFFFCAYGARLAGLEPIIGAFIAGLTLNALIPENSLLMNRISFVGETLFIPFFLISVGMLVNISLLFSDLKTWSVIAFMVIIALASKFIAAIFTSKLLKYSRLESFYIFGLTVNQAAATLAAVLIGYQIGLFDDAIVTGTIVMIGVTCFVGAVVTEKTGRRLVLEEEKRPFAILEKPQRISVLVSSPESADQLIYFAMLIRRKSSHEPIFPLNVVEGAGDIEEKVAKAEKLLSGATVHALSSEIPVNPIVRVDTNFVNAVKRAVSEIRISTVIMEGKTKKNIFAPYISKKINALLMSFSQMLIVLRSVSHFHTVKRLLVVIPPLVENQNGLEAPMTSVKQLAGQLSAGIVLVGEENSVARVFSYMESIQPSAKVERLVLPRWDDLLSLLEKEEKEGDMLALFNARPGQIAWRPALNRLPQTLISRFTRLNLALFYAPTYIEHDYRNLFASRNLLSLFTPETTYFTKHEISLTECLDKLLSRNFSEDKSFKIRELLSRNNYEGLVELRPGVVLLHSHTEEVEEPVIFMGSTTQEIQGTELSPSAHTAFVLLSPASLPPEGHLKLLALLASFLQPEEVARALRKSDSLTSLRKAIGELE